jgi:hypothetical protein
VCGTKNFASVRLYSAPQLHLTIVAILGICAYGTPKQVESRFFTLSQLRAELAGKLLENKRVAIKIRTAMMQVGGGPAEHEQRRRQHTARHRPPRVPADGCDGGAGVRYAVVYKANRDQIRNPNRIHPGQIFVLPMKARERAGQNH